MSLFVTEGPKNYSYRVRTAEGELIDTTKVRGFTLNYESTQKLNHNAMKEFVLSQHPETIFITEPHKIQRKRVFRIVTQSMTKKYKPISSKRRKIINYATLPYGDIDSGGCNDTTDSEDENIFLFLIIVKIRICFNLCYRILDVNSGIIAASSYRKRMVACVVSAKFRTLDR